MMFDSPNSTTPNLNPSFHFPFPSSSLPPFINTYPYQDLLSDHHFPLPNVHETLIVGAPPPSASKPPPKGRHSKIHTSQGLRDRRVRLSIDVARQFFDLQDMLGFDKASKTLDWLLCKSKNAIKDLARSKHESPASSDCHVATTGSNQNGDHAKEKKKKKITRAKKKICCGKTTTAMNQSVVTRASTSTPSVAQKNNNSYCFPNLALDWDDIYNPALLPPSSFVVSSMNLCGTGLGAQREHTMY